LTTQNAGLPAVSVHLVPFHSRPLPAVSFSGLDGVKRSPTSRRIECGASADRHALPLLVVCHTLHDSLRSPVPIFWTDLLRRGPLCVERCGVGKSAVRSADQGVYHSKEHRRADGRRVHPFPDPEDLGPRGHASLAIRKPDRSPTHLSPEVSSTFQRGRRSVVRLASFVVRPTNSKASRNGAQAFSPRFCDNLTQDTPS
jgi:hypothetical protein